MRELTDAPEDRDLFWAFTHGHAASALVWAAIELDLFTRLAAHPGQTLEELARSLALKERPLRIVLTGLVALGLLTKAPDGRYACGALAAARLSRASPTNMIAILEWQHQIVYRGLFHFADAVRQGTNTGLREFPGPGTTLYERLSAHPGLEATFHRAMRQASENSHRHLVEALDWGRFASVVDVGGGDGTNVVALVRRYPDLRGVIFEIPSVCELARATAAASGLAERIDVIQGNFLTDPLPRAGCHLFSHIIPIFSPETNLALLTRSHKALQAGGAAVVFNTMGDDQGGPMSAALGSAYFLAVASGEGMFYTATECEGWLRAAGFARVERLDLPFDHVAMIGMKG